MAELAGETDAQAFYDKIEERYRPYRDWALGENKESGDYELWAKWLLPELPEEKLRAICSEMTFQYRQAKGLRHLVGGGREVCNKFRETFLMSNLKNPGGEALAKAVEKAYTEGQTDYSLEPMCLEDETGAPVGRIRDGDHIVFCCRRGGREIELTEAFVEKDFSQFERTYMPDLEFVIMTMYHDKFKLLPIAFAPEKVRKPLARILSEAGKTQFHCAERRTGATLWRSPPTMATLRRCIPKRASPMWPTARIWCPSSSSTRRAAK